MADRHVGEFAELYALGALSDAERYAVDAHVAGCAECRRRIGAAEEAVLALECGMMERATPPALDERMVFARSAPAFALGQWARLAAAFVLGAILATSAFSAWLHPRSAENPAIVAMIDSHFNHSQFAPLFAGAPAAKVIYARDRSWLYVLVKAPRSYGVYAGTGASAKLLGESQPSGATSELFVEHAGGVETLELRDGSTPIARAQLR